MEKETEINLSTILVEGLKKSFEDLVEEKIKNNQQFAFYEIGKVVVVDAIDVKKEIENN